MNILTENNLLAKGSKDNPYKLMHDRTLMVNNQRDILDPTNPHW
jgi:hypothetical protein